MNVKKFLKITSFAAVGMAMMATSSFAGQFDNYNAANNADREAYSVQSKLTLTTPLGSALDYSLGAGVDLTNDDLIYFDVTGADLEANSELVLNDADGSGAVAGAISQLPATTQSHLVYRVTTDGDDLAGGLANPNFLVKDNGGNDPDFDLSGLAKGQNVSVAMKVTTSTGIVVDEASYNVVEGVDAATLGETAMSDTKIIDVAQAKKRLINGAGTSVLTTQDAQYRVDATDADLGQEGLAPEQILYVIEGDMTGVANIAATGVTSSDSTGDVAAAGAGAANEFYIDAANNKAYAVNTAAVAAGANLDLNDIAITFDGTTVLNESDYSIKATVKENANLEEISLPSFKFASLRYNGTIAYAGMVVGSGNKGWGGGFRIVNRSNQDANINITCQAVNGGDWTVETTYAQQALGGKSMYISADKVYETCGLPNTTTGNVIITVEAANVDIFQTATTPSGHTIIPLTKSNNQDY